MSTEDLKEIKEDVKEVKKLVGEINVTLARNTASLEIHEKRTTLSEVRIQSLEYWLLGILGGAVVSLLGFLLLK